MYVCLVFMWFEVMSCPPEMRAGNEIRNRKIEMSDWVYVYTGKVLLLVHLSSNRVLGIPFLAILVLCFYFLFYLQLSSQGDNSSLQTT